MDLWPLTRKVLFWKLTALNHRFIVFGHHNYTIPPWIEVWHAPNAFLIIIITRTDSREFSRVDDF